MLCMITFNCLFSLCSAVIEAAMLATDSSVIEGVELGAVDTWVVL